MTHVVFDVGQVLIRWEPWRVYREDFASRAEIEGFLDEIGFGPWNVEQDRGRSWDEAVKIKVAEFPQHAAPIRKFHSSWHDAVPGPIDDTVEALRALQAAGKPFYGITNFSAEKWAECQERFDFLTLFEDVIVSAHERLVKPDPAIFQLFLSRNGLRAEDCLFIDDSPANIAAAQALGFQITHFDGTVRATDALRERGII
ncbi:MAG: HAD family phosphatase [Pseudomonadota bacterium]